MNEFLTLDATDQIKALRQGAISARKLLELSVQRADVADHLINAVITRDLPRAFAEADEIDARRARSESLGPLAGLPMTVKEHYDIEGFPSSFGGNARFLKRQVKDAAVIARLRAAGAIICVNRRAIFTP